MNNTDNSRRINILRDSVSRRIAAGEVIDRPQAVVRELLDNAIDAEADDISLYIEKGGTGEVRIVDNGSGMDEENLKKCFLPHATSKINDFEDIYSTRTLGFRGEALSSIAACSKLKIISSVSDEVPASCIEIQDGKLRSLSASKGGRGTLVSARDIFFSMPGRKNFLKSPSAESAQCRSMFIEKALPHLSITFRYFSDEKLKLFLPAADLKTRLMSVYGGLFSGDFISTFSSVKDGLSLTAAAGGPSLYRKDRKYIQIFINNRRVNDYSLVQAVDFAYSNYLPGGTHPVCFLFLNIPPEHVDFNIHPAKREVKFRDLPSIHHTVTEAIGEHLKDKYSFKGISADTQKETAAYRQSSWNETSIFRKQSPASISEELTPIEKNSAAPDSIQSGSIQSGSIQFGSVQPGSEPPDSSPSGGAKQLIYLGQLFNLFLVFEWGDDMLLVDQHAAHERIIYNGLNNKSPEIQELLVPLRFSVENDEEASLEKNLDEYKKLGFELEKAARGDWLINSMPSICTGMEDDIISLLKSPVETADKLRTRLFAAISCRTAIMDGDKINDITAIELADSILKLENPRCPHGRPIIQLFSREDLFKMFRRTF